jgi:hypothetical protein
MGSYFSSPAVHVEGTKFDPKRGMGGEGRKKEEGGRGKKRKEGGGRRRERREESSLYLLVPPLWPRAWEVIF